MSRESIRIVDLGDAASSEDQLMRLLLRGERAELPSDAKMRELEARLGPIVTSGGAGAPPASVRRWWIVVAIVGTFAAGTLSLLARPAGRGHGSDMPAAPRLVDDAGAPHAPGLPSSPDPAAPTIPVESLPPASAPARGRPAALPAAPSCVEELVLVDRADGALRSGDANGALALTREHAERCPAGAFVQERERIAIEALGRLGRQDEMRARARSFERRFPSSPHIRWIRSLLETESK